MFTENLFRYFDEANKNKFTDGWFEKNKTFYEEAVKNPFTHLIDELSAQFGDDVPLNTKKISRPVRPKNRHADLGAVKDFISIIAAKPKPSRFEHPPCLHIQMGALPKDNFICVGMYLENSKQMKKIHQGLDAEFDDLVKTVSQIWGPLEGAKYKRTPNIINSEFEEYYWYKTFYFNHYFERKDLLKTSFKKDIFKYVESSLPFYQWLDELLNQQ